MDGVETDPISTPFFYLNLKIQVSKTAIECRVGHAF